MWDCYDGAWQQQWTHHPDGRIELVGKGQYEVVALKHSTAAFTTNYIVF